MHVHCRLNYNHEFHHFSSILTWSLGHLRLLESSARKKFLVSFMLLGYKLQLCFLALSTKVITADGRLDKVTKETK